MDNTTRFDKKAEEKLSINKNFNSVYGNAESTKTSKKRKII